MTETDNVFPPHPRGLKGRRTELAALARVMVAGRGARVALVGSGGSGKSMLACALGHRLAKRFPGGIQWFRSGPWDARTLGEMAAIRFGTSRARTSLFSALRAFLTSKPPMLIVLDNHENDSAVCSFFNEVGPTPASWLITARRCLLGGVYIFPVIAPLAATGAAPFPRVRALATLLRHNPLALDIADALVRTEAIRVKALEDWLKRRDIERVRVIDHEDDLPEVALLIEWAWSHLSRVEKRVLAVLAHTGGDHMDIESLERLSGARDAGGGRAIARLRAWRLVQSPFAERYALHAVVRHAVLKRTRFSQRKLLSYYLDMLERWPARLDLEQTHLYAAMDYAHTESKLDWMLRIENLLRIL